MAMRALVSNRRRLLVALALVGACGLVAWLVGSNPRHPEFGKIYRTEMVESGWERTEAFVRRALHRERPLPAFQAMQVGPARLGWSVGGHIYMYNPDSNDPLWEFALSSHKHLTEVTHEDLHCEFYGMNDPRGTNVFGPPYLGVFTRTAWEGHAIRVADGQVFFARLVTNRSTIYAVQLGHWNYTTNANGANIGRIRAEYIVATNAPPGLQSTRPAGRVVERSSLATDRL